jgi:hypothetical protein
MRDELTRRILRFVAARAQVDYFRMWSWRWTGVDGVDDLGRVDAL